MKTFTCACGAPLFFDNTWCLSCNSAVGYDPLGNVMVRLTDGGWETCANGQTYGVCNWVLPSYNKGLCQACQINRVIPDLSLPQNLILWRKMEAAKRRAIYWLLLHGLPVRSKLAQPETGLAVDFLLPQPDQPVLTGHQFGVLTFNVLEADDSHREDNRNQFGEPYRTLLGHFRHEIAHYYWWLWFDRGGAPPAWLAALREVFGDDRRDYASALQAHYQSGQSADWNSAYISAYAATHPWEDWAETWAHYTLITDALETARSTQLISKAPDAPWSLKPEHIQLPPPFDQQSGGGFLKIVSDWLALAPALNEMSLSLGHSDLYPFSPTAAVVRKMHLIHAMVTSTQSRASSP